MADLNAKTETAEKPEATVKEAPATLRVLMGEKVGMTQIFDKNGNMYAVTVVKAGPCLVTNVKTSERDGYNAVCLGFGDDKEKGLSKPLAGQFKKAGIQPLRHLKEFRVADVKGYEIGQTVSVKGRFAEGDYIDVQGVNKGHGFAGGMKRHNFRGLPASHGASDKERSPGSLASQRSLGRVIPGQRMAGHMGVETVTIAKLELVKVDPDRNLVYINGSVPGSKGSLVFLLETGKNQKRRPAEAPAADKKAKKGNAAKK